MELTLTERADYLDSACQGDPALRSKVETLLQANDQTDGFLEAPPPGLALTIRSDRTEEADSLLSDLSLDFLSPSEKPGCLGVLGVYEIVGVVGRGAFGIVFRAFDTKLNRIVAINSDLDPVELRKLVNVNEALLIWASAARAVDQPR